MKTVLKQNTIALLLLAIFASSCGSLNNTQKGVGIGTGAGAVLGAVIGNATGNTGLGTAIGAVVGGTVGGIIGKKMDKQAEEIKNQIPNAKVERVEEGITVEFNSAVLFGFNQADISAGAENSLNDLVVILNKYPDTNIEIDGHTDNKGTPEYNQTLSEKRATIVAAYLIKKGIAKARVTTKGLSFSVPKYTNDTPEGRTKNRRVEFIITANDKMKTDAQKEAGK
jgi:outer membrane protein OmpA-like peptidoglycan-associated protein